MTSETPVHNFLLPRLSALLDDAVANGVAREVAVAVLIDLITSPLFDTAAPDPGADSEPHPGWEHKPDSVVTVSERSVNGPRALDAQDEADFIKPTQWSQP